MKEQGKSRSDNACIPTGTDCKKVRTRGEAITVLCKARDELGAVIKYLLSGSAVQCPWDIYNMDVEDIVNTVARLRAASGGTERRPD